MRPDQTVRSQLISAHLTRLEQSLAETQRAVASLRDLLEHPSPPGPIEHRQVAATEAAAIRATVDVGDLLAWYQGAIGEIGATLSAQDIASSGPPGGIYADQLFSDERGEATVFVPVGGEVRPVGRVQRFVAPQVELATITHTGSHADVDRSYGALATYVSEHALAVDGPDPRVLPGRPPRHRRRAGMAHRDRLADLRHRQGPGLAPACRRGQRRPGRNRRRQRRRSAGSPRAAARLHPTVMGSIDWRLAPSSESRPAGHPGSRCSLSEIYRIAPL